MQRGSDSHLEVVSSWRASTLKSQMNHFLYSSGHDCLKDTISHTHCHVISPQKWLKTTLLSHKHNSTATLDHIDIRKITILQQNNKTTPSGHQCRSITNMRQTWELHTITSLSASSMRTFRLRQDQIKSTVVTSVFYGLLYYGQNCFS